MPRNQLAWLLIGVGVLLAIPGALVVVSYLAGVEDVGALNMAPVCAVPTQDQRSECLSEIAGEITAVTPHSKSEDHVTLAGEGESFDLGYDCFESPAGACAGIAFKPGTPIVEGWWRGHLVSFGAAESRPSVVTELNPLDQIRAKTVLLGFTALPAVAFATAGLLLRQAPMTIDDLVRSALATWPDPLRPVDRRLVWRVALGYWAPMGLVAWFLLYMAVSVALALLTMLTLAVQALAATFVLTLAASALIAGEFLSAIVCTSDRRALKVLTVKNGLGKSGKDTQVSYELLNGKTATKVLDPNWNGRVKVGDLLDALTDPKSGSIVRLLSTPPAQA